MRPKIIAINGFSLLVILAGLLLFSCFVFFCYPKIIQYYLIFFSPGYVPDKDSIGRGTYGDMYGALNTFFSGLAFIGLITTILLQLFLHQREQDILKYDSHQAQKKNLLLLKEILSQVINYNSAFIEDGYNYLNDTGDRKIHLKRLKYRVLSGVLILIREKISEGKYFDAISEFSSEFHSVNCLIKLQDCYSDVQNFLLVHDKCLEFYDSHILGYDRIRQRVLASISYRINDFGQINSTLTHGSNNQMQDLYAEISKYGKDKTEDSQNIDELFNINAKLRINNEIFRKTYIRTIESIKNNNDGLKNSLILLETVIDTLH